MSSFGSRVLADTLKNVVTVPLAVVQRSSQGLFAWVIAADDTAENRPISVGPSDDAVTVVTSGLQAGERVVVSRQYRLRAGVKVDATGPEKPVVQKLAP